MALSGSRLNTAMAADILTQLQSYFPVNASLLTAEKALYATAQQNLANAIAAGSAPDIVSEITGHAVVPIGIAVTIPSTASTGNTSVGTTTGTGTVT